MSEKAFSQKSVEQRLRDFLLANGLRQTKERFAILNAVYDMDSTFTIEELQRALADMRFRVSTATLYNTTQLLVQANLLIRHPFSSQTTLFERIADEKPRNYQICNNCHRITRIKSKELMDGINSSRPRRFDISHRVLYVYGICPKCEAAMRKKLKQLQNNIQQ